MKKCSAIWLLFLLATFATVAQETYLNTTLRKQSWSDLPVVYVNEAKGGLQTINVDFNGLNALEISDSLNVLILPNFRSEGMIVVNTDPSGNARNFQLLSTDIWREVFIISSWQSGVNYIPGQPILHNGNLFIAKDSVSGVEPLVSANWKKDWANLGGLDSTDLDFALKNLSNLEDVAINQDLTAGQTDTLNLGSALLRWSNLYLADSAFIGADTIADVATLPDWTEFDTLNSTTVSSVGYTHKAIMEGGNEMGFIYGTKEITRTGLPGITGNTMEVDNLEDFLKKVFFPVTSPKIISFNYNKNESAGAYSFQDEDAQGLLVDNVGTINVPYSIWNASSFDVYYGVENRSVRPTDSSEKTPIDSVSLFNGSAFIAKNVHGVIDDSIKGNFTVDQSFFTVDVDNTSSNPLKIVVYDAYGNEVPLQLNVDFQPALGVLVNTAEVTANAATARYTTSEGNGAVATPYLIERTGADIDLDLYWTFNERDDAGQITDIGFSTNGGPSTPTAISGTGVTDQRGDLVIPNDHLTPYRYGVRARGAVANDWSTVNYTRYYQLADRYYRGVVSDTSNISDEAILAQLTAGDRLKYDWTAANTSRTGSGDVSNDGYDFPMTPGDFAVFAIPIYDAADINNYGIEIFDLSWGGKKSTWAEAIGKHVVSVTGKGVTQYLIVYRAESAAANTTWTLRLSK